MDPTQPDLEHIGHGLREALLSEHANGDAIRQARALLVEDLTHRHQLHARRARRTPASRWIVPGAAAMVAAAAAFVFWPAKPPTFDIGVSRQGRLGDAIETTNDQDLPLRFSDGSSLLLRGGGQVRVLSLDPKDARVVVEKGTLDVAIHRQTARKIRWRFEAGPYRVLVTGTKFRLAFSAREQSLSVTTTEGQVVVQGGCPPVDRTVSAGERVDLRCPTAVSPSLEGESLSPAHGMPFIPDAGEADAAPDAKLPLGTIPTADARPKATWRTLLAAGNLAEALRQADRAGLRQVGQLATAEELAALSDAARLSASAPRAALLLRALRSRFPGSPAAATAAFKLGLLAFEQERDYAGAVRWFETYLRENPTGPLMGDSFGRLMKAKSHAGDSDGARTIARQYLHRFPEGPYALDARGILLK